MTQHQQRKIDDLRDMKSSRHGLKKKEGRDWLLHQVSPSFAPASLTFSSFVLRFYFASGEGASEAMNEEEASSHDLDIMHISLTEMAPFGWRRFCSLRVTHCHAPTRQIAAKKTVGRLFLSLLFARSNFLGKNT